MRRLVALVLALLAVLGLSTLSSVAQAQTFEVGYEVASAPGYQGGAGLELAYLPPATVGHFFVYATTDVFLFEIGALDTQVYLSPSAEITVGDRYWLELQLLVDAPIATLSATAKYESSGRLEGRIGVIITPFD